MNRGAQESASLNSETSLQKASLRSWDERMRALDERRGNWEETTKPSTGDRGGASQGRAEQEELGGLKADKRPEVDSHTFGSPSVSTGWPPSNVLSRQMLEYNKRNSWINADRIGGSVDISRSPDMIPIVLYVHNRPSYLRVVLDALSKVRGIEETVLIVSHDGYYQEVAEIVQNVTFTRVKQVCVDISRLI
jgi:hypothetical protein